MDGTRRRAPVLGRFVVGLSGLALFAFACFPLLAYAEGSIEGEYKDAPPTVTGTSIPGSNGGSESHTHGHEPLGTASSANPPGSGGSKSSGQNGPSQSSGVPSTGGNGAQQQRNPQKGQSGNQVTSVQPAHQIGAPASSNGGGGSSPLVPIIIAILALAALSVAALLIRQRRQGPGSGSSVSPKAG